MSRHPFKRRAFLHSALLATGSAVLGFPYVRAQTAQLLGQADYRYRVVPGWGVLDEKTPVKNCHGIVRDRDGHVILLTDHTSNNVVVYDKAGKLVHKWGTLFPGAHGLSLVNEGGSRCSFYHGFAEAPCVQDHA